MSIKIVFFDCDGTLTNIKSSWQYLHERLALWDDRADEYQRLFKAGRIDYQEFCRRDAALWKGLSLEGVMEIIGEIGYRPEVRETIAALKESGIATAILSTGLSFLVERAREDLGVGFALANELLVEKGVLTGGIRVNIEHGHKGHWVKRILGESGIRKSEAAAVGDDEGDREMFQEVGLAIGYHPGESVLPYVDHVLRDGSFRKIFDLITERR